MTELLTRAEAAEVLRWSRATLYGKLRDGVIPSIRLGEYLRMRRYFFADELAHWTDWYTEQLEKEMLQKEAVG